MISIRMTWAYAWGCVSISNSVCGAAGALPMPDSGLGHITVDTFGNLEFHIILLGSLFLKDLQKADLYFLM